MHRWQENERPNYGVFSSALGAETSDKVTSAAFVHARNYHIIAGLAQASGVASDSVITLKLYEAKSAAGSASQTISGASDTFTSTNTTDTDILKAEVRAEQLSDGFEYVGMEVSTSNASGTEKVAGMLIQAKPRYAQATLPA